MRRLKVRDNFQVVSRDVTRETCGAEKSETEPEPLWLTRVAVTPLLATDTDLTCRAPRKHERKAEEANRKIKTNTDIKQSRVQVRTLVLADRLKRPFWIVSYSSRSVGCDFTWDTFKEIHYPLKSDTYKNANE